MADVLEELRSILDLNRTGAFPALRNFYKMLQEQIGQGECAAIDGYLHQVY